MLDAEQAATSPRSSRGLEARPRQHRHLTAPDLPYGVLDNSLHIGAGRQRRSVGRVKRFHFDHGRALDRHHISRGMQLQIAIVAELPGASAPRQLSRSQLRIRRWTLGATALHEDRVKISQRSHRSRSCPRLDSRSREAGRRRPGTSHRSQNVPTDRQSKASDTRHPERRVGLAPVAHQDLHAGSFTSCSRGRNVEPVSSLAWTSKVDGELGSQWVRASGS